MVVRPSQSDLATLYERDTALWSTVMAELLRQGQFDQLDLEHLITELSGYSKPTFMELLGKAGIPVFDYSPEELEQEMNLR